MKRLSVVILLLAAASMVLTGAGCGNVYLTGEALTAAETSAMDAYGAAQRAGAVPAAATQPAADPWLKGYLVENFKQWRSFVRSARRDLAWGPKLDGE